GFAAGFAAAFVVVLGVGLTAVLGRAALGVLALLGLAAGLTGAFTALAAVLAAFLGGALAAALGAGLAAGLAVGLRAGAVDRPALAALLGVLTDDLLNGRLLAESGGG
ncbi:MAG: hypothetical protein RI949_318, partial [Pseudomonadota bacterium]